QVVFRGGNVLMVSRKVLREQLQGVAQDTLGFVQFTLLQQHRAENRSQETDLERDSASGLLVDIERLADESFCSIEILFRNTQLGEQAEGVCDGVVVRSIHEPLSGKHSFQDGLSVVQTIPINEDSCQVRLGKDAIGMSLWNPRVDANGILRVSLRLHKVVCPNEGVREVHEYDADAWIVGASQTLDDLVGG